MRGEVGLGVLITTVVAIMIAGVGGFIGQNNRVDAKFDSYTASIINISERLSTLEEAVGTLKTDNGEIKRDVKTLIQIFK